MSPRGFRTRGLILALLGAALLFEGCTLTLLYITSITEEGGIVTVVLAGDPDGQSGGPIPDPKLVARVPEGWSLASATFSGTAQGERIVGTGAVVPSDCTCLCNPPAGYQDIQIASGGVSFLGDDAVTMTVRLAAAGSGTQTMYFRFCINNYSNILEATVNVLPSGSGLVFVDDFESAGTSSWSQVLAVDNGGFEFGDQAWNFTTINGVDPIVGPGETPVTPFAGEWIGQLGVVDNEVTSLSPAEFLLPVTPYRLKYHKWLASSEPTCNSNDWFSIWVNNVETSEEDLCVASSTGGWVEGSLDLGAWAGQWVIMYFSGYTDEDDPSVVYLDEVGLSNLGN